MSATRTVTADPPTRADGILARLGRSMATHTRLVVGVWLIALIALGAAAPSVFTSLAGAVGRQTDPNPCKFASWPSSISVEIPPPQYKWSFTRILYPSRIRRCSKPWPRQRKSFPRTLASAK